jgi:hypothetical protein
MTHVAKTEPSKGFEFLGEHIFLRLMKSRRYVDASRELRGARRTSCEGCESSRE